MEFNILGSTSFSPSYQHDIGFDERWLIIKSQAIEPLENYLLTRNKENGTAKSIFTAEEYSKIYTLIYNMCTHNKKNWSRQLYLKYSETLEIFLREKILIRLKGVPGPELIFRFQLGWSNYLLYLHWMERFFGYLNKYYLKIAGEGDLMFKGMSIFYNTVFLEVKDALSTSFCNAVESSRLGKNIVEDEYLKEIVIICLELSQKSNTLDIYENEIEGPLIDSMCSHYKDLAEKWAKIDSLTEYLSHVQDSLNYERKRCVRYLTDSTWNKFKKTLIDIFLSEEMGVIESQQNSIQTLLFENKFEQLKLLYSLLSPFNNGMQILSVQIKKYTLECGQKIIEEFSKLILQKDNIDLETLIPMINDNDVKSQEVNQDCNYLLWTQYKCIETPFKNNTQELLFVQTLISLYDHLNNLLNDCFEKDALIQKAINESFEIIINMDVGCHNQAQLICNYCDNLLKKDRWKSIKSHNLDDGGHFCKTSTKIVELFSFVHFQDYFLEIYRHALARRLLQNQSADFEKEELVIIYLLRNKCGTGFTSKLEGMIADIQNNRELNKKYNHYLNDTILASEVENKDTETCENNCLSNDFNLIGEENGKSSDHSKSMEFYVNVLTSSNWPTFVHSDFALPLSFKKCIDRFEEFYFSKTDHRKLSWIHWYGRCIINYNKKDSSGTISNYEITCNTFQTCILLLFNNNTLLSFNEIKGLLQMDHSILKKQIDSLTTPNGILTRRYCKEDNSSETFKDDDLGTFFEINPEFKPVPAYLNIKTPSQGETIIKYNIEEDRSHAVEAAIVRIMKFKRELEHGELVSQVSTQLESIRPSNTLITNKINYLIDREYLCTHEKDPTKYIYVA